MGHWFHSEADGSSYAGKPFCLPFSLSLIFCLCRVVSQTNEINYSQTKRSLRRTIGNISATGHVEKLSSSAIDKPNTNKRNSELPLELAKESNRKPLKLDPSWVDRAVVAGSLSKVVASSGIPLGKFLN